MLFQYLLWTVLAGNITGAAIEFTENLRLGPDQGDEYIWSSTKATVSVDALGNMYVMDPKDYKISVYDPNGQLLKVIGKKGDGPGEFQKLMGFSATPNGALGIDLPGGITARSHQFGKEMQFLGSKSQEGKPLILEMVVVSPSGKHFGAFYVQPDRVNKVMLFETAVFDNNLQLVKTISHKTGPLPDRSRMNEANYWVDRLSENLTRFFEGVGVFSFDEQGRLYSGQTQKYEITRWDPSMKKVQQLYQRSPKPKIMTEDDSNAVMDHLLNQLSEDSELADLLTSSVVRQALAKATLPPAKNPIYGVIPIKDGAVMVVTSLDLETRETLADVFATDGAWLGEVTVADFGLVRYAGGAYLPKMIFRGDYAYTIITDENDDNILVRYTYKLAQ